MRWYYACKVRKGTVFIKGIYTSGNSRMAELFRPSIQRKIADMCVHEMILCIQSTQGYCIFQRNLYFSELTHGRTRSPEHPKENCRYVRIYLIVFIALLLLVRKTVIVVVVFVFVVVVVVVFVCLLLLLLLFLCVCCCCCCCCFCVFVVVVVVVVLVCLLLLLLLLLLFWWCEFFLSLYSLYKALFLSQYG